MSNSNLISPLSWRDSWSRFYISGATVYQYTTRDVFLIQIITVNIADAIFLFLFFQYWAVSCSAFELHAIVVISNKSIFSFCRYILAFLSCVGRRFVIPSSLSTLTLFQRHNSGGLFFHYASMIPGGFLSHCKFLCEAFLEYATIPHILVGSAPIHHLQGMF